VGMGDAVFQDDLQQTILRQQVRSDHDTQRSW